MELGDIEPAWNHFQKVLEMEAQEVLRAWPKMARKIIVSSSRPSALGLIRYSTSGMHSERIQGDFLGTAEDQVEVELMSLLARISFCTFIWVEIETCRSCES